MAFWTAWCNQETPRLNCMQAERATHNVSHNEKDGKESHMGKSQSPTLISMTRQWEDKCRPSTPLVTGNSTDTASDWERLTRSAAPAGCPSRLLLPLAATVIERNSVTFMNVYFFWTKEEECVVFNHKTKQHSLHGNKHDDLIWRPEKVVLKKI